MIIASIVDSKLYESQICDEDVKNTVSSTLRQNALNAGFANVEVKEITETEHNTLVLANLPQQAPTTEDRLKSVEDAISALMGV